MVLSRFGVGSLFVGDMVALPFCWILVGSAMVRSRDLMAIAVAFGSGGLMGLMLWCDRFD
jgi:hypothetical protein